jgi:tRNA-dihydrouridine synthase B
LRDKLYLAPLQSFTDFHFRNAFQKNMGDVDTFYAPYLKLNNDGSIKEQPKKDVLLENNPYEKVIPQVLACCSEDFLTMTAYLSSLGYDEVNWNLGCPYPMVAKRDLGSGILNKSEKIIQILEEVQQKSSLNIGIKMRMGYEDTSDILTLLPQLDQFPLTEIIIHARYGKQLYTGTCDLNRFEECLALTKHKLVYNGDITSVEDYRQLKNRFPYQRHWMIGRGAISNPFLFEMIQENDVDFPEDWQEVFHDFLMDLAESNLEHSNNKGNVLQKMIHYWEYFSTFIPDGKTLFRQSKKCKTMDDYFTFLEEFLVYDFSC